MNSDDPVSRVTPARIELATCGLGTRNSESDTRDLQREIPPESTKTASPSPQSAHNENAPLPDRTLHSSVTYRVLAEVYNVRWHPDARVSLTLEQWADATAGKTDVREALLLCAARCVAEIEDLDARGGR
jgi:hypothetical protein